MKNLVFGVVLVLVAASAFGESKIVWDQTYFLEEGNEIGIFTFGEDYLAMYVVDIGEIFDFNDTDVGGAIVEDLDLNVSVNGNTVTYVIIGESFISVTFFDDIVVVSSDVMELNDAVLNLGTLL